MNAAVCGANGEPNETMIGLEEILRSAQPRLILRVKQVQDSPSVVMGVEPFISETDLGWDELLERDVRRDKLAPRLSGLPADCYQSG